jgi:DNA-binding transcriptional MerR regulator
LVHSIPDKRYFTIGEVSKLCGVKPHVLRYWEQEFSELQAIDRRSKRRYYQKKDVLLVLKIKALLRDEGFTINGARLRLSEASLKTKTKTKSIVDQEVIEYSELVEILKILKGD